MMRWGLVKKPELVDDFVFLIIIRPKKCPKLINKINSFLIIKLIRAALMKVALSLKTHKTQHSSLESGVG